MNTFDIDEFLNIHKKIHGGLPNEYLMIYLPPDIYQQYYSSQLYRFGNNDGYTEVVYHSYQGTIIIRTWKEKKIRFHVGKHWYDYDPKTYRFDDKLQGVLNELD